MIYLDTHLLLWLYAGSLDAISKPALQAIEENDLYVSPMALLELQYLSERKKLREPPVKVIEALYKEINLKVCTKDFHNIIQESLRMNWTRDPFDRIIVAHAALNNNMLLTKDDTIRAHYKKAIWGSITCESLNVSHNCDWPASVGLFYLRSFFRQAPQAAPGHQDSRP